MVRPDLMICNPQDVLAQGCTKMELVEFYDILWLHTLCMIVQNSLRLHKCLSKSIFQREKEMFWRFRSVKHEQWIMSCI